MCVFGVIVKINKQGLSNSFEFFWKSCCSLCSNLFVPFKNKKSAKVDLDIQYLFGYSSPFEIPFEAYNLFFGYAVYNNITVGF